MQVALTIAGSDSGGGAGIQADLKTFAARGVFGTSVITAITAQNTLGVSGVVELPVEIIAKQFDAICSDFDVGAAKIGMLSSAAIIEVVAEKIKQWKIKKLVVDPVMVAKGGDRLLHEDAVNALIEKILPLAYIVTPNLPEAETLSGSEIVDKRSHAHATRIIWETMRDGRETIQTGRGDTEEFFVLIKGGHRVCSGMAGDEDEAEDVLFDGASYREYSAPRIESKNTHGTGCTFSAAIAAELAKGAGTRDAVQAAKDYITRAIRQAPQLGHGHGPLQHFPS